MAKRPAPEPPKPAPVNAKARRQALDSPIVRKYQETGGQVVATMRATGSNYTNVHNTLIAAGLLPPDPEEV